MVAAVATLEPDVAENSVAVAMLAWSSPPGSQDSQLSSARYVLLAIPVRTRISPSNINSGIAISRKLSDADHKTSPIALISGKGEKNSSRNSPSTISVAATGTPVSYTHLRAHETDSYLVC